MALDGWKIRMKRCERGYSDELMNPKELKPYLTSQDPPFSGKLLFNKYNFGVGVYR